MRRLPLLSRRKKYVSLVPYTYTHLFYFHAIMGVQHASIRPAEQDPISRLWSERTSVVNETAVTRSFAGSRSSQPTLGGMAKYDSAVTVPRCCARNLAHPLCVRSSLHVSTPLYLRYIYCLFYLQTLEKPNSYSCGVPLMKDCPISCPALPFVRPNVQVLCSWYCVLSDRLNCRNDCARRPWLHIHILDVCDDEGFLVTQVKCILHWDCRSCIRSTYIPELEPNRAITSSPTWLIIYILILGAPLAGTSEQ